MDLTAVDLFSGCGGLTCGLQQAGYNVLAAVEIDKKAQITYALNHPHVRLYKSDIRLIEPNTVMEDLQLERGQLGLLAGCPPCQGFSRLRTRNKSIPTCDIRNDLIYDFMKCIKDFLPKTIMMENVPGLQNDGRFAELLSLLHTLKYNIDFKVLNAADYSVPQRRKRLILLASRIHQPKIACPHFEKITVREAFSTLDAHDILRDSLHNIPESRSNAINDLIQRIPKNGGSRADLGEKYQLACHKKTKGFFDVYGRMSWDEVAPTITSGCSNPSKGRFLHPSDNRTISLREAAILQGFPKDYLFDVSHGKQAIALMIGNALPPPFIKAHALSLIAGLG